MLTKMQDPPSARTRFSIRDLWWFTALAAVATAWWIDHRAQTAYFRAATETWEHDDKRFDVQMTEYERQMQLVDAQLRKQGEQNARSDALLDKWEEQARRYDTVLEAMERQYGKSE